MAIAPVISKPAAALAPPPPKAVVPDVALQKQADRRAATLPRLRTGAKGRVVASLQNLLRESGNSPGKADGQFGPKTAVALKQFQRAMRLPQTGVADRKTWSALIKADLRRDFTFKTGQQDGAIKVAEARLAQLGYRTGKVDGFMDAATASAIRAFGADEGFRSAGTLTSAVRSALGRHSAALNHAPVRSRVKNTVAHRRLDAATATQANGGNGIREGERGRAVKNVQAHLLSAGYSPSRTDGVFDERTGGAVKAFQRRSGLPATGVVDGRTWAKLKGAQMEAATGTSPAQSLLERSGAVKQSEALLKKLGFNPGKIDGLFDTNTQKAVKAFERKFKRSADGKISTGDLKKMQAVIKQRSQGKVVTAYVNGRARKIRVVSVGSGEYLRADAARAWKSMQAAARRAGVNIGATSGFRTMAEQKYLYALYRAGKGNLAARPGYSNHQNGIAMDISGVGGRGTRADRWLLANARKFGFRNLPSEYWHYDYVR